MTVAEHIYDVPSDDELARLVGAATPHFSLQIRDRVLKVIAVLPPDHPRLAFLHGQVARLERMAFQGEVGRPDQHDLPSLPSVVPPGATEPEPAAGTAGQA